MPSKIGHQRVPFEGPERDYNILVVGEAPGGDEEGQGRPFVGKAGQLAERYFGRAGVPRSEIRWSNLSKYRPLGNKFRLLLSSKQLEDGIAELKEEILANKPNLVVGFGNWPLYFLTGNCGLQKKGKKDVYVPGTGIGSYRGSRLPMKEEFGGGKFFATFHPAYINRDWHWNPVFYQDILFAVEDSKYPELRYPEYDSWIDPEHGDIQELVREAIESPWISKDIETFPNGQFSCVGWSWRLDGRDRGVTVTFRRPDLWRYAQQIWEAPTPSILQFGNSFDSAFMEYFYQWKLGGFYDGKGWDTFVASASIYPDYPRGLDFLASVYTRFPYYKTDRKIWKNEGDLDVLFNYNIKDCVATYQVAMGQMKDIEQIYGRAA